jgi:hypothetical protein
MTRILREMSQKCPNNKIVKYKKLKNRKKRKEKKKK